MADEAKLKALADRIANTLDIDDAEYLLEVLYAGDPEGGLAEYLNDALERLSESGGDD